MLADVQHARADNLGDVWSDLATLAQRAPHVIGSVATIVRTAEPHLPQIAQIVTRAGAQLPQILQVVDLAAPHISKIVKVVRAVGPQLPRAFAVFDKVEPHIPTILAVAEDPAFGRVAERVETIRKLEAAPSTPRAKGSASPGVGLKRIVPALDAYIYVRKRPWLPWVVGGGAVLTLFGVGFGVGRLTSPRG